MVSGGRSRGAGPGGWRRGSIRFADAGGSEGPVMWQWVWVDVARCGRGRDWEWVFVYISGAAHPI